jgi:uncharacterized protein YndB with AHSA1/START domain
MSDDRFVYVTYIRTTAEKVWQALTQPEFTRQYWFGMASQSEFTPGAAWNLVGSDGRVWDSGEVLEADPPRHLILKWQHQMRPELHAEGYSRATFSIEPQGETVKLTVVHEIGVPDSKLITAVSGGWPMVLSSLKSLLETGSPITRPEAATCAA